MSFSCIMLLPCIIEFSDVICLNDKMQALKAERDWEGENIFLLNICSEWHEILLPSIDSKVNTWENFCFTLLPSSSPFLLFPRHAELSTLGLCTRPVHLSGIIFQIVPWLASLALSSFCSDIASLKWIPLTILCEASSSLKLFNLLPCFLFCCSIDPYLTLLKVFVDWLILCLLYLECKFQEGRASAMFLE